MGNIMQKSSEICSDILQLLYLDRYSNLKRAYYNNFFSPSQHYYELFIKSSDKFSFFQRISHFVALCRIMLCFVQS